MNETSEHSVESTLRAGLARGDAVIGSLGPALRHLLASDDNSLFSDEIIARIRGMAESLAQQLLIALAKANGTEDCRSLLVNHHTELTETLLANSSLLGHLHALALEWQLTQRIQQQNNVDPVLSPLLQSLIASSDAATASTAMAFLAAQARFVQS
ncbi:MAG TPA: hypothetical protein VLA37_00190, partial [Sphingomonadaceae bacterium]|nr:hypothetical protein [Sphingomonadaceae bacterium]